MVKHFVQPYWGRTRTLSKGYSHATQNVKLKKGWNHHFRIQSIHGKLGVSKRQVVDGWLCSRTSLSTGLYCSKGYNILVDTLEWKGRKLAQGFPIGDFLSDERFLHIFPIRYLIVTRHVQYDLAPTFVTRVPIAWNRFVVSRRLWTLSQIFVVATH
jgi:hypothetical protein